MGVVQKGLRPTIPASCPAGLAAVMRECWQRDPRERPAFEQLKVLLSRSGPVLPGRPWCVPGLLCMRGPLWREERRLLDAPMQSGCMGNVCA